MFEQIMSADYLNVGDCQKITEKVFASPGLIASISKNEKVFRLGAESKANWWEHVEPFREDFDRLKFWLEDYFKAKVEYHPLLPPPGFHVFYATAPNGGKIHADGQAFFSAAHIDYKKKFLSVWSIVVSINMPPLGGGLHMWKKSLFNFAKEWGDIKNPLPKPDLTLPMPVGKIIIFDSRLLHQIEGFQITDSNQARITLVAHLGEISPGRFVYFWDKLKNVAGETAEANPYERGFST